MESNITLLAITFLALTVTPYFCYKWCIRKEEIIQKQKAYIRELEDRNERLFNRLMDISPK